MGYYRLFLALCVLTSHCIVNPYIDEGRSAVIGFFLISGYAMGGLLQKKYGSLSGVIPFYADRLLRIFPLFLFFAVLTILWIMLNPSDVSWHSACTAELFALNLALVPLYFSGHQWYLCTLLPQSWSLSLELLFYIFVPFIALTWSRWTIPLIAAWSLYFYGQAFVGIIDTDANAFRHLPGTLYIFLVGMTFAREGQFWKVFLISFWVGAVCLAVIIMMIPSLRALNSNPEIVVGLVLGIPGLALFKRVSSSQLEQLAGSMSYGLFLAHYLVICIVEKISSAYGISVAGWPLVFITAMVSLIASYFAAIYIEKPVAKMRRWLRAVSFKSKDSSAEAIM